MKGSTKAIAVGVALSVAAAALLWWRVSFRDVGVALSAGRGLWLAPALALFFVMFGFRAWRWSVLLGGTPFWHTWHANIIGYFFNVTLPLRLGEIARAYVISRHSDVTMARALSVVLVERLIDLGSVLLLFAWFAQRIPMRPSFTRAAAVGAGAVVACVMVAVFVALKGEAVERAARPRLARLGKARADSLLRTLRQVSEALRAVGSARRLAQSVGLTIVIWAATIGVAMLCLQAFVPEQNGLTCSGLVVVMANLGGALPSAPAGLGVVQGFATSALVVPFGIEESRALAFVLVWTLGPQVVLVGLGFVSIGRVGLSFREIRAGAARPTPPIDHAVADD